ncbi:coiled-coil domain-containing protein 6-like [Physella acuta]|uniref:coiled-coil domain-containing protein 6-like n=1 Tax=Physella acuta TaxID=109671 RepID=UPI0027DD07DD|nr:coiled-coil domain-containing protein 6-like [Physella acuta]XP_059163915.1 coiled-coil domain-containing protein 6-like [Physella acuta]XP_059163916.1 coiled-coil domain-containing protein 6-like [Physella acuta]XP_059163917.1 coiled-coil domain-containing protein 6-like [Physella acuta]XP_059163918.1 coiled-coil domain-containing protein 6-like [Physella acuta]XP_059163919.1 coiled-coil domain-containing protein 6-like [Physella acuta]XP_059163920.1 coiled-coil domain-containing protein 
MADSASELESDTSSIDGGPTFSMKSPSPAQAEQLNKRIESLQQENRVLKMELDTYKLKCKSLQEENRELRRASVSIQAKAEQEEEFISNTLLKKIQSLKKEKEMLAMNYEQEEEYLTNDLSRKLYQLRQEKIELEETLEKEQECQINKLMRKIEKLEADTYNKQQTLEQLRREKVELENSLEQEQESLVNRLWKRMDKLEAEKRLLQEKLDQPVSAPPSPRDINNGDTASNLVQHIDSLRSEVTRLKDQLRNAQIEHAEKMAQYAQEERHIREENLRLQRRLQLEMERRENLCRHLSESESSLEMDDERHFNEIAKHHEATSSSHNVRPRTVSSPIPYNTSAPRSISPSLTYVAAKSPPSPMRRPQSGQPFHPPPQPPNMPHSHPYAPAPHHPSAFVGPGTSPPVFGGGFNANSGIQKPRVYGDKFAKPSGFHGDKNEKT